MIRHRIEDDRLLALRAAAEAAFAAQVGLGTSGDDGGSCNSDAAFLYLTRPSQKVVAALAPLRPCRRERDTYWPPGYSLHGDVAGQGARMTRVAETIARVLKDHGFNVVVRYEVD